MSYKFTLTADQNTYYFFVPSFEGPKSLSKPLSSSGSEIFPAPCVLSAASSMLGRAVKSLPTVPTIRCVRGACLRSRGATGLIGMFPSWRHPFQVILLALCVITAPTATQIM